MLIPGLVISLTYDDGNLYLEYISKDEKTKIKRKKINLANPSEEELLDLKKACQEFKPESLTPSEKKLRMIKSTLFDSEIDNASYLTILRKLDRMYDLTKTEAYNQACEDWGKPLNE